MGRSRSKSSGHVVNYLIPLQYARTAQTPTVSGIPESDTLYKDKDDDKNDKNDKNDKEKEKENSFREQIGGGTDSKLLQHSRKKRKKSHKHRHSRHRGSRKGSKHKSSKRRVRAHTSATQDRTRTSTSTISNNDI